MSDLSRFRTTHYEIRVGPHAGQGDEKQDIYQIVNREHGVIEYQDYLLPRALDSLLDLQKRLDETLAGFLTKGAPESKNPLTIVGGGNDGTDGLH